MANNYKIEGYDLDLLRKARHNISRVYNYHYGAPNSRQVVNRLETLKNKLDDLIEIQEQLNN